MKEEKKRSLEGCSEAREMPEKENAPAFPAHTCVDCRVMACCGGTGKSYPPFCLTEKMDPALIDKAMAEYKKPDINRIAVSAAEVEADYYCRLTRVEETMKFAEKIGARRIGIATCVGLLREAGTAAQIFRAHGFEVFGAACKCGAQKKVDIGIPKRCEWVDPNMCNPVLQAMTLNREKTDLDVMIGLCVGHDSLFLKYAEAPVTVLVVKDRVLGNNPAAALYTADSYYGRLLHPEKEPGKAAGGGRAEELPKNESAGSEPEGGK